MHLTNLINMARYLDEVIFVTYEFIDLLEI